jgi:TorA maturation chaperone TorD
MAPGAASYGEEDVLRARFYRMLSHLLQAPPKAEDLELLAGMTGDATPLGEAVGGVARVAAGMPAATIGREFHNLFIGLGRGELVPYGSYYLTGFLHEKPLAKLRADLIRHGIERAPAVREPEDHIAALCGAMAGLILGEFGEPATLDDQKRFFKTHIAPWAKHFFTDLEAAKSAVFYAAVGRAGVAFMEVEETAFEML